MKKVTFKTREIDTMMPIDITYGYKTDIFYEGHKVAERCTICSSDDVVPSGGSQVVWMSTLVYTELGAKSGSVLETSSKRKSETTTGRRGGAGGPIVSYCFEREDEIRFEEMYGNS